MNKYSLSALVAAGVLAGGMAVGSAQAADLGGNCCADLEERIAELEATTARKGNRKVSLTVSGWVGQQMMFWDDGAESNVYITDLGTTLNSHVKFTGQANITPGWSAGYVLQLESVSSEALLGIDQNNDNGGSILTGQANDVQVLQSFWFVKSEQLGKVSLGLQSQASDNTAILVDGSGSLVPANFVAFDYGGFFLRNNATGALGATRIFQVQACTDCNGLTTNSIRYDSPTFAGFSVSASWGEDDFWDVAARYAGEFADFKLAVAGAYAESTDEILTGVPGQGVIGNPAQPNVSNEVQPLLGAGGEHFQVGGYLQHVPTGLFGYLAYVNFQNDLGAGTDAETWYAKAGLRTRLTPLGATVFYGEYQDGEIDTNAGVNVGNNELWGLGVVQEIDAAAMSLFLTYRSIEADNGAAATESIDFDYVKFGGLINF